MGVALARMRGWRSAVQIHAISQGSCLKLFTGYAWRQLRTWVNTFHDKDF
jgi:hypothetical protein